MLLENRVLWGAVASVAKLDAQLPSIIEKVEDVRALGSSAERVAANVEALRCHLVTPIQYTRDIALLRECAISPRKGIYGFEFVCAALKTPLRRYYCFFVPFRRMLGGVLRRINSSLRGKDCLWHRLEIMDTVEFFRGRPGRPTQQAPTASVLCGLDLHLMAGRGEQEIVFVGMNPAQSRVFKAVADEAENFTLSPISATFCVGSNKREASKSLSYFTIDRSGVVNVSAGSSFLFLGNMVDLLADFERLGTLKDSPDRPVYRSRNEQKRAILASISA